MSDCVYFNDDLVNLYGYVKLDKGHLIFNACVIQNSQEDPVYTLLLYKEKPCKLI
jgi:site-specific DNA-adenine methylase